MPLLALAAFSIALLTHEQPTPRALDIQLTPPPQAELSEIQIAARVRVLEGTVVDRDGEPLEGALVWLLSGDEPRWAHTDAQGVFRLDALQRAPWDVRVVARDHSPLALVLRDTGAAQQIVVPDERRTAPVVAPLVRAQLTGTVLASSGDDVDGAEVVLTPLAPPEQVDAALPRRARADPQGHFSFPELVAGEYRVEVLPAWARGGSWPDLSAPLVTTAIRSFTHLSDGSAPLTIGLVSGSVRGRVLDPDGRPLAGAFVLLSPADRPDRPWPPAATDARGTFTFRGLPPGRYAIEARAGASTWVHALELTPRADLDTGDLRPQG